MGDLGLTTENMNRPVAHTDPWTSAGWECLRGPGSFLKTGFPGAAGSSWGILRVSAVVALLSMFQYAAPPPPPAIPVKKGGLISIYFILPGFFAVPKS